MSEGVLEDDIYIVNPKSYIGNLTVINLYLLLLVAKFGMVMLQNVTFFFDIL